MKPRRACLRCQIQRSLGIKTYKTAWYLCHRIRKAMLEAEPKKLGGTVEIDETYVGGKKRRWRPKSEKKVVIGIRQRNGDLRLIHAEDARSATVREIINANIGGHVEVIMTDESAIYPWALEKMHAAKAPNDQPLARVCSRRRSHKHGRIRVFPAEARHRWLVA